MHELVNESKITCFMIQIQLSSNISLLIHEKETTRCNYLVFFLSLGIVLPFGTLVFLIFIVDAGGVLIL
jgi:hypothetical protein